MKILNDCVKPTVLFEIDGECQPMPLSGGDTIINNYITNYYDTECCQKLIGMVDYLTKLVLRQDTQIRYLIECCNKITQMSSGNIQMYVEPGQILNPPREMRVIAEPQPQLVEVKSIRDVVYESYETPFYPNSRLIDISGEWVIDGDLYINRSGEDLRRYLPYTLNLRNEKEGVILEAIVDYRIINSVIGLYPKKEVILVYKVRNISTNSVKTFEAGLGLYKKWYKIHSI